MHALLMIGTGEYVPPARGRRNRDAQAQKRSPRTTARRGQSYFWGDSSERLHTECPRQGLTEDCTPTPNQHAPGGILASVSWHLVADGGQFVLTLLLVEAALSAQSRSRRACSLASHTAHALAPHSSHSSVAPVCLSPRDLQAGCGLAERGRRRPAPPAGVAHRSSPVSRAPFHSLLCLLLSSCLVL